jgi:ADP-heptose:LPS heptosyltransferase
VDEYLQLARFLGAATRPVEFHLPVERQAIDTVADLLADAGVSDRVPLIVISPSPSQRWKAWPIERWAAVAAALADRGTIAIAGTRGHQELHRQLVARTHRPAVDLTGRTTLSELVALLQRATLHVAHDSGSVHIAAALGTRVVALYGPTSPSRLAPFGQADGVVYHGELCGAECPAYCFRGRRCLAAATPDELIVKARRVLDTRAQPEGSGA